MGRHFIVLTNQIIQLQTAFNKYKIDSYFMFVKLLRDMPKKIYAKFVILMGRHYIINIKFIMERFYKLSTFLYCIYLSNIINMYFKNFLF